MAEEVCLGFNMGKARLNPILHLGHPNRFQKNRETFRTLADALISIPLPKHALPRKSKPLWLATNRRR
jgi:hypothetical protein